MLWFVKLCKSFVKKKTKKNKLYPSVPIDKAIDVILQQLSEDYEDLKTITKLTLVDIKQLIELCISECYFLWDNVI